MAKSVESKAKHVQALRAALVRTRAAERSLTAMATRTRRASDELELLVVAAERELTESARTLLHVPA
ncbi:MAG: hypothetical protein NVSMB29_17860 [Candidatus Dormibacteria bacterium]